MPVDRWDEFAGANRGYVLELYERYQIDPDSVDAATRALFERLGPPPVDVGGRVEASADLPALALARAVALVARVRDEGHHYAQLDPLGDTPAGADALLPERFGLSARDLLALPAAPVAEAAGMPLRSATALDAYRDVLARYAQGTVGYEFAHLASREERAFIQAWIADDGNLTPPPAEERHRLLERLTAVEALDHFLHSAFPGVKRFSIEGVDSLVPMLDRIVDRALDAGLSRVAIGMAHRGRLSVLAHVLHKPYRTIVGEFDSHDVAQAEAQAAKGLSGDVKYHLGWRRVATRPDGGDAEIRLLNNPSHLEVVDPVVAGVTRAAQDDRSGAGEPRVHPDRAVAVAIHGDSAFPGEGVVAETLNLAHLRGYNVGGTLHIITNNQIGFTTDAADARSTRYASDPAKGYDMPIAHVNADDPEACLAVVELAWAFRQRFGRSFLIDLVGYRRWGHNEGDEPSFTQPVMYARIRSHPTVRALYADRLAEAGLLERDEADRLAQDAAAVLAQARKQGPDGASAPTPEPPPAPTLTRVTEQRLRAIGESLFAWPADLAVNQRLARTLGRRLEALDKGVGVDWGFAETLAFATLIEDGVPIRLAGQDAERGTFAQRHLVLHGEDDGQHYTPLGHLPRARATFAVFNSPLSETAAMGFEYGYSVAAPETLVIWEAQYGDFANVGQAVVDQFVSAARAKWGERSGLVLLLPHGYEGQGPEHSSARLERYLQMAAEDNMVVADLTSAAQYFHLLREHAGRLGASPVPLVLMSPKSLLRHPLAASSVRDLVSGGFHPVLDDPQAEDRRQSATRLVLATGKIAIEYLVARETEDDAAGAIVRLERLYPFPQAELAAAVEGYPQVREVVWLQEEPRNMGAWTFVEPYLQTALPRRLPVRYVGPAARSAPASGYAAMHAKELERILAEARTPAPVHSAQQVR